jgi:hypothetical protein
MSDAVRRAVKPGAKSHAIFAIGLVAIVSGLIACNDTPQRTIEPVDAPPVSVQNAPAPNPNSAVGEGHNAMVDAVLRDVAKKRSKKGPQKKLCKQVEESAIEYARLNAKNPGEAVRLVKDQNFCGSAGSSSIRGAALRANMGEGYGLSARAVELLNATDYYLSVSYSGGQLASYLGPINGAAMSELDWEEAQVVTSATSVAVSSLDYWSANLPSWGAQFQGAEAYLQADNGFHDVPLTPKYSFWGDVWDIAKADLEGAISGGVGAKLAKAAVPEAAMWVGGSKSLIRLIQKL